MVAPVTGPFTTVISGSPTSYWRSVVGYRQKKPYTLNLPLNAQMAIAYRNDVATPVSTFMVAPSSFGGGVDRLLNDARSKAWAKFVDHIGKRAMLATNLLELSQSVEMIVARTKQLARFAKALKKGRLLDALRALADPDSKVGRQLRSRVKGREKHFASKSLANQWLELHFGWAPLIDDIYTSIQVLQSDFHPIKAVGKAKVPGKYVNTTPNPWSQSSWFDFDVCAMYTADVRVTNPNLAMATGMGLTNPSLWAFESIPFSFVLDWFTNASQFLGAWNEFLGYSVENGCSTAFIRSKWRYHWNTYNFQGSGLTTYHVRELGLNRPGLYIRPFRGLSTVRAATAMSLLLQFLPH